MGGGGPPMPSGPPPGHGGPGGVHMGPPPDMHMGGGGLHDFHGGGPNSGPNSDRAYFAAREHIERTARGADGKFPTSNRPKFAGRAGDHFSFRVKVCELPDEKALTMVATLTLTQPGVRAAGRGDPNHGRGA